ncbi:MAG: LptA/OstA family protein [Pseudohongiellaceae bacterium]|nr:LptA/OstA family protein [Pseudohongiellaceae bacterium]
MNHNKVNSKRAALISSAFILSLGCSVLQAQQTSAHEYSADGETTIETVNGLRVITLRENVYVKQNQVAITGDVAVLEYNQDNELQTVQVNGSPAHFEQSQMNSDEPVTGNSDTINYYAGSETTVEFIGSANFQQPGNTLQCAQIKHTIESGATSGQACSGALSPQEN